MYSRITFHPVDPNLQHFEVLGEPTVKCLHQPNNFPAHQIRQVSLYQKLFYLSSTSFLNEWW